MHKDFRFIWNKNWCPVHGGKISDRKKILLEINTPMWQRLCA